VTRDGKHELERFGARHGDEVGEIVWAAAIGLLEQAAGTAREGTWCRWRTYPRGELRRLRSNVSRALALARLAVALQDESDAATGDLAEDLRQAAAYAASRAGRARTLDAEYVRVAKSAARRAGAELNPCDLADLEHWGGSRADYYERALARHEARL
jgi:hypothetical protein